jgi:uncharacterized membrane protein YkoI
MRSLPFLLASIIVLAPLCETATAQPAFIHFAKKEQAGADSAGEAAQMAQAKYGGQVLKVKQEQDGRRYKVRLLLDDGRIKEVTIKGK